MFRPVWRYVGGRRGDDLLTLQGLGVSPGVVIGRATVWRGSGQMTQQRTAGDPDRELMRFTMAQKKTVEELERLHTWVAREIGESDAQIFAVHAMMVNDEDFVGQIITQIREEHVTAEFAVSQTERDFERMFFHMEDSYMR